MPVHNNALLAHGIKAQPPCTCQPIQAVECAAAVIQT